jgi:pyruvate, water dikinase
MDLARQAVIIEAHYGRPMDIEWALDGVDGEAVHRAGAPGDRGEPCRRPASSAITCKEQGGKVLATGRAIGRRSVPAVRVVESLDDMDRVQAGDVLVTDMTDPDWEPIMKRAAAIVTNRGGRTCHAAIIARELGIPAVVGCGNATETLPDGQDVTVILRRGRRRPRSTRASWISRCSGRGLDSMPDLPVKVMMNVGNPGRAFHFATSPTTASASRGLSSSSTP